jgi:hypothetical protein
MHSTEETADIMQIDLQEIKNRRREAESIEKDEAKLKEIKTALETFRWYPRYHELWRLIREVEAIVPGSGLVYSIDQSAMNEEDEDEDDYVMDDCDDNDLLLDDYNSDDTDADDYSSGDD